MSQAEAGAGMLYVVATPIGNLGDISARAISVLGDVDLIAAEDTRHSARLLQHLAVDTPMFPLHEFNEGDKIAEVMRRLESGANIALISDAGTPLISDPGYQVVREARGRGIQVVPVPGPSSVTAALSVSGLPTDRFIFEGFLPSKPGARLSRLRELAGETRTLVFFEAPHRIAGSVADMADAFGGDRFAVLARELSKTYETVHGDRLDRLPDWLAADDNRRRGEFVVLVHGAEKRRGAVDEEGERVLAVLMRELPLKQAAALTAEITGLKKNLLYQYALQLKEGGEES